MRIGDDGEIEFLEPVQRPKRKKKSFARQIAQGCGQLLFLAIFFIAGSAGGFAFYFFRNPNRGSVPLQYVSPACMANIKMISVAGTSVMFPNPPGYFRDGRTLISLDSRSQSQFDRSGQVDSLNLAKDEKHVIESRYEQVAPYFFIYTWVIDNFGQFNERILTDGKFPSYSPDAKRIALFRFSGYDKSALYIMDADGSNSKQLATSGLVTAPASWSADGKQLVFSSSDPDKTTQNVYIVDIDDGSKHAIVNSGLSAEYPAWSPDGKSIAYVSHDIYTINTDGSNRRNITNDKFSYITNVGWSPDSQNIAFLAQDQTTAHRQAIYVVDNDGSGLHKIYSPCPN